MDSWLHEFFPEMFWYTMSHFVDRWRFVNIMKAASFREETTKNTKKKININHIKEKTSRHIGRQYELRPSRKKASTVEVWTLPPPYDSWQRLQLTPVTLSSGSSGCWKWMDGWYEFVSCAPLWWFHVRALAEPLQPETDVGAFKINMRNWAVAFGIVIESITWCFDHVGVWYRRH